MKEKMSLVYKWLIIVVTTIGLIMNFSIAPAKDLILYFTILSNLMVLIFYIVSILLYYTKKLKKNDIYYIIKGMITICITLTLAVYNIVIKNVPLYQHHVLACGFVHIYTPILVMLDYVLFGEKGHLKLNFPFIWSIFPLLYTLFCFIYMSLGGTFMGDKYPYTYMDIEQYGTIGVLNNCLVIFVIFILYGFFVCYLDDLSKKMGLEKKDVIGNE